MLAAFLLKWAPERLATKGLKGKDKAEEIGRTRTAVLATLAGLIAVTGAILTGLSYRLSRAGQITERFTRAIDQLGSTQLDVRLGGIYALERLARDSPRRPSPSRRGPHRLRPRACPLATQDHTDDERRRGTFGD